MTKLMFYDLETTGTDCTVHAIHQLSAWAEINGAVVDKVNILMAPWDGAIIEPVAMEVAGVTEELIRSYPTPLQGYGDFIRFLSKHVDRYNKKDKLFLAGFNNASFDDRFLRAFFERHNNLYFNAYFWSGPLDVYVLAAQYLRTRRANMESFKLFRVAHELGLEVDQARLHDADYDLHLTRQIYRIVTGLDPEI